MHFAINLIAALHHRLDKSVVGSVCLYVLLALYVCMCCWLCMSVCLYVLLALMSVCMCCWLCMSVCVVCSVCLYMLLTLYVCVCVCACACNCNMYTCDRLRKQCSGAGPKYNIMAEIGESVGFSPYL